MSYGATTTTIDRDAGAARTGGWRVTLAASCVVFLTVASLLFVNGLGEAGLRSVVRATARTSFALFVAAFAARALLALRPARPSRWLAENQPHLFASFALSHLLHAAALAALAWRTGGSSLEGRGAVELAGGAAAYLFILAGAAPVFTRAARWLEAHRPAAAARNAGLYYVWFVFLFAYGGRAATSARYAPFVALLSAALALRVVVALSAKTPRHASARG
jgi:methionine sulfoxide reductase heme-binding subunit